MPVVKMLACTLTHFIITTLCYTILFLIAFVVLFCFYKYGNGDFGEIEILCIRLHDSLCQDHFCYNSPALSKFPFKTEMLL